MAMPRSTTEVRPRVRRLLPAGAIIVAALTFTAVALENSLSMWNSRGKPNENVEVEKALTKMGVGNRDLVSSTGDANDEYRGSLARMKIMGDVLPNRVHRLWAVDVKSRKGALNAFSKMGVQLAVGISPEIDGNQRWVRLGRPGFSPYSLPTAIPQPGERGGSSAAAGPRTSKSRPAGSLARKNRWFYYKGSPIYLVGVDAQQLVADPRLDYSSVLSRLQPYKVNKVRIWLDSYFSGALAYRPWKYDASTKRFDLDTWNSAYWRRLAAFVGTAEQDGIIVEVSLFNAYPSDSKHNGWWRNPTWRQAWNKNFNINNAFSTNSRGAFYPEFYSLHGTERSSSGKSLLQYQQALIDKAISTLQTFPNVYFELDNEFPGAPSTGPAGYCSQVYGWQLYWARYIKRHTSIPLSVHAQDFSGPNMTCVQHYQNRDSIDVLDFHFYDRNPDHISRLLHRVQRSHKILQSNESFNWTGTAADLDGDTREAWGWFLSGGYYSFYEYPFSKSSRLDSVGKRIRSLQGIAGKVQWWTMSPVNGSGEEYDSLARQGPTGHWQILANPDRHYIVYFWDDGSIVPGAAPAEIKIPAGRYSYSWYDPTNETLLSRGSVRSTGAVSLTAVPAPPASWNRNVGVVLLLQVHH